MNDWGIRARVILLALIPTAIVAVVMGAYFVTARVQDLNASVKNRGITIANYVAQTAEYSLLSRNTDSLNRLVSSARDGDADILAIAVYSNNQLILASSGAKNLVGQLASEIDVKSTYTQVFEKPDGFIVGSSISSQPNNSIQGGNGNSKVTKIGSVAVFITNKNMQLRQYQTIATAFVILLIGMILGGVLARNMSRNITLPIIQLANAVKRIKEGQLKVEIKTKSSGELKTLVDGFNDMSDSLYEAREEMQMAIEQATADINATNTALEEQNVELNMARKEAVEASRVKSEFLANMSHEIRTPMNGVIGFTNLLLNSNIQGKQKDYLTTIKKSANGLLSIIDNILDFSKIEAGKMEIEQLPLSISDCVDETLNLLGPSAQAKGIEFIGIVYQDVPHYLKGDAGRICQVLTNLCNNAIKFTEKGTIQIRVMLDEESESDVRLRVNITDTGVGLTNEQQKVLFQAFTQADTTTTRRSGGTGLGLVISKKLVESMSGKIGLESEKDIGSTFWFTMKLDKDKETLRKTELGFPGRRVLFHDQNKTSQLSTKYLLERWGAIVEQADSLSDLIDHAKSQFEYSKNVHLILIGGYSPKKHKQELIELGDIAKKLDSPIACLINSKLESIVKEFSDIGFNDYLSKPVMRLPFYRALHKWFKLDDGGNIKSELENKKNLLQRSKINVLCVDDNEANLKLIDAFLSDFDVEIHLAASGKSAIEQCNLNTFDIIFMDIQMPEMDGLEATKLIRQSSNHNRRLPIMALTAHAMKGEKERLLSEGLDDYLTKPISQSQLRDCISKWTGKKVELKVELKEESTDDKVKIKNSVESKQSETSNFSSNDSINWELSLKNAGGRSELARELLTMLVNSFGDAQKLIGEYYETRQIKALLEQVHKLHGATAYCGVPNLKSLANQYESMLKSDPENKNLHDVHLKFNAEIETIKKIASNFLQ